MMAGSGDDERTARSAAQGSLTALLARLSTGGRRARLSRLPIRAAAALAAAVALASAGAAALPPTAMASSAQHPATSQSSAPIWVAAPPPAAGSRSAVHRAYGNGQPAGHGRAGGAASPDAVVQGAIWSGYAAAIKGVTYTSVTATWIQPLVTCTSNGDAAFWVGLDGYGNSTVEQTGTAVDCSSGTPQYYAWWEFYPAPETKYTVPVYPGDTLQASVTYLGSDTYSLKLTDVTRGWSENTGLNAVAGNASAEIIAEAASNSGGVTALPDFTAAQFSNATINGGSLQAANVDTLQMINSAGGVIAYPGPYSSSGNFTAYYSGGLGSAVAAAVQGLIAPPPAPPGYSLFSYSAPGLADLSQPMAVGTSPAIAQLSNGSYEMAYQSSSGALVVAGSGVTTATGLPMMAGTSPAIAASPAGGYEVAYQASNGYLWTYTASGGVNQFQGMLAGTSPAIAALSTGGYETAFQANTGILIVYGAGGDINTGLGMKSGTSPSIAGSPNRGFEAAFQANTGFLWTYSTSGTADLNLGMAAGTSPAIAALAAGGYEMAFQATSGVLFVYGSAADLNTGVGMAAGTSPGIAGTPGGGYETAIQANTSDFTLWGTAGNVATNEGMRAGTSPAIAG